MSLPINIPIYHNSELNTVLAFFIQVCVKDLGGGVYIFFLLSTSQEMCKIITSRIKNYTLWYIVSYACVMCRMTTSPFNSLQCQYLKFRWITISIMCVNRQSHFAPPTNRPFATLASFGERITIKLHPTGFGRQPILSAYPLTSLLSRWGPLNSRH